MLNPKPYTQILGNPFKSLTGIAQESAHIWQAKHASYTLPRVTTEPAERGFALCTEYFDIFPASDPEP